MGTTPSWLPFAVAGIGVLGTLAAGIAGALIAQRWADRRDDKAWARERAREDWKEQLNSCSAFAAALTELRQREIALWFQRRRDPRGDDTQKMATECDRAGASADFARFRVQLVSGAPDLMTLADSAYGALEPIRSAAFGEGEPIKDLDELREHETSFEAAVKEFLQAARAQLRAPDSS
jgi:hypothetical protein